MSGFAGFTGKINNSHDIINKMCAVIKHRGNRCGFFVDEGVAFGFRRIEKHNNEPINSVFNEDESITAVLDGEIYNRAELFKELSEKEHTIVVNSDVELIVHLYEEFGVEMVDKLNGVFAFAIFDKKNERIFVARDHFGVKPFYYAILNGHFIFGSELKSLLQFPLFQKELNALALENYLTFQYSVLEETFFKGAFKLLPAHYLVVENGKISEKKRYWTPKFEPDEGLELNDTIESISDAVNAAVEKCTVDIAETAIGSFLSSGVDSSYIAATFSGEKTFTVGFSNEEYNETTYAQNLAGSMGKQNYNRIVSAREYWDVLPKVQHHMDEPLADPAAIALYFVSELAAQHVDISLSGEGADEFFGGYNIYKEPAALKPLTRLPMPIRRFLGAVFGKLPFGFKGKNYFIRGSKTIEERFIGNANVFSKNEREILLNSPIGEFAPAELTRPFYDEVQHLDDPTKMQYIDINFWLAGDILLKADKMSMAHSLKVRSPLLGVDVFNLAAKLPTKLKLTKTTTKHAFRLAAAQKLPPETAQKKKLGFPVPIRVWLKDDTFYKIVRTRFESDTAKQYFNTELLIKLLNRHKRGKADNSRKIWVVYMFLVWHGVYFAD